MLTPFLTETCLPISSNFFLMDYLLIPFIEPYGNCEYTAAKQKLMTGVKCRFILSIRDDCIALVCSLSQKRQLQHGQMYVVLIKMNNVSAFCGQQLQMWKRYVLHKNYLQVQCIVIVKTECLCPCIYIHAINTILILKVDRSFL